MKPTINWSAIAALFRTLVILFASTFVGALVLPLAADGTLPMSWPAWRPVLAVGLSAAIVSEVIWIRGHLAALAASVGLGGTTVQTTTSMTAHTDPVTAAAAKIAPLAMLCLALSLTGCVGGVPTPATQAVIDASANLALCVETVDQHDETETPPAAVTQVLIDEGVTCGPEAAVLVNAIGQETTAANKAAAIEMAHASVASRRAARGH